MSKALDQLNKAVTEVAKNASGKVITKDQIIEMIDDNIGFLRNASQFFVNLGDSNAKLKEYIDQNRHGGKGLSMDLYNKIFSSICVAGQKAMNERFLGAFADTLAGLTAILEGCNDNIDAIFADKTVTIYNTKISQVAVFGMVDSARIFSQYVVDYIALFMSDKSNNAVPPPAAYTINNLKNNMDKVIELINRVLGSKLSKTFVAAIKRYRSAGTDTGVVNSDNKATVQFAKINNDVTESDITAGSKGLRIFKWIGDWFVDRSDNKLRKLRAERDILQARAQLLQLELDGTDEKSPEYKRQVEIIKNYQKLIDRLNQKLAKYDEE